MCRSGVSRIRSSLTEIIATVLWGAQSSCQPGSKQFVDQHARMLRIILELHHVVVAVVATHQMRLRAAPHSSYLFQSPQHARLC